MSESESLPTPGRARPAWWILLIAAVLVVALGFAIGRFSTFGQSEAATPATPTTDSAEAGFARDMQVHHEQAVQMAMEIYRKTDNEGIRVLAYDIATSQSGQKGEFFDWLVKWNLPQAGAPLMSWMMPGHDMSGMSEQDMMAQMGMASSEELAALTAATGTTADCQFLSLMIRHHQGAIPMAQALIERGSDPRALDVAQGVVATQTAEIDLMTSLQLQLGCAA